jgi:hypothetical protein
MQHQAPHLRHHPEKKASRSTLEIPTVPSFRRGTIENGFGMNVIPVIVLAASVAGCLTASEGLDRPTSQYDASWYRANGWSGEYPDGFTMTGNVTTKIRGSLNLDAPKSISCMLRKGATYHQWNKRRVSSDRLEFTSFTKIETYELDASFTLNFDASRTVTIQPSSLRKATSGYILLVALRGHFSSSSTTRSISRIRICTKNQLRSRYPPMATRVHMMSG